jgi:hypothetical protein
MSTARSDRDVWRKIYGSALWLGGSARPRAAHWINVDFWTLAFNCHYEAEGGSLSLSIFLPGGRAQSALCVKRPFLTSAKMEPRVPQVRRLPLCISRARTTYKCLAIFEGLGRPSSLIFARAICAAHALSLSVRSAGFCVIWVCISSHSSSRVGPWGLVSVMRRPLGA